MSLPVPLLLLLLLLKLKELACVETMPSKVIGSEWGIRVTMTLTDEEEASLAALEGFIIVYHAGGTRAKGFREKPHYHMYLQRQTDRDSIAAILLANSVISKYHKASNSFWSIDTKSTYNLESFWHYVWDQFPVKRQRLIVWNDSRPQLQIPENPLVIAHGPLDEFRGTGSVKIEKAKKSSLEKQQKFLAYCKEYYEDNPGKSPDPKRILKLLYDYCKGNGFTTESCCFVWVNYALANLSTDEKYKEHRRDFVSRLAHKFF